MTPDLGRYRWPSLLVAALGLLGGASRADAQVSPQASLAARTDIPSSWLQAFRWRNIGPLRSGRSIAVAGSTARPSEYYSGATGGGLWKTTNGGTDWFPVTDGQINAGSVGAVAVCEQNPDVVYIGTGEGQFRAQINMGDGVYRSSDAGKTWRYLGLGSSSGQTAVARVRVDPRNCDRVYAAVVGDPWGPNPERGVFRSLDGGQTWSKVLNRGDSVGASDLVLDPGDSRTIYAALWQVRRRPWEARSGGPGSGLFKSTDDGETWVELTGNPGFAQRPIGKIGVAVSPADPQRVYAVVEAAEGGVFRSDDGGATWVHANGHRELIARAEYYVRIYADPGDRETVYVLDHSFLRSRDGGNTYQAIPVPHGDNQDLWIAPNDAGRMIEANDGGANVSVDGGRTWTAQDYSTAQMYHVITTNQFPYQVCGAQQDNGSRCVPSDGDGSYWYAAAAGEQGYIALDPRNPNVSYGGSQRGGLVRLDRGTGQERNVEVWPDFPQGLPPKAIRERFQWTFPIVMSPQDPDVIYVASQHLWRTRNGGHSWEQISPDLTYADPATLEGEQSIIRNQNSQDYYATIFAVALSPLDSNTIWTGSDDGLVHVTRDGGRTWQNVTPRDVPKFSRVSQIATSPHAAGKAYLAIERYKMQDLAPYAFKTEDYGKTWTKIVAGIPADHYVRVVREDPVKPGLLFAGTEHAPYVSFNDGASWQSLRLNLPDVQVADLAIKDNDVVIATYGRGFYILDDASPMRHFGAAAGTAAPVHLFPPVDAIRTASGPTEEYRRTTVPGANRVSVYYALAAPAQRVTIEVLDAQGSLIRSFAGPAAALPSEPLPRDELGLPLRRGWSARPAPVNTSTGLHRFDWDLRYPPAAEFPGINVRAGNTSGPVVVPGQYQVRVTVDGRSETHRVQVWKDPRLVAVTQADLAAQFEFGMRVHRRLDEAIRAVQLLKLTARQVDERVRAASDPEVVRAGDGLKRALLDIEDDLYEQDTEQAEDLNHWGTRLMNRIAALKSDVWSADSRPTTQAAAVFELLSGELDTRLRAVEQVFQRDVARFNEVLRSHRLAPIDRPSLAVAGES